MDSGLIFRNNVIEFRKKDKNCLNVVRYMNVEYRTFKQLMI